MSVKPQANERAQDRELRRHAAERQIPADESKRILDVLDPPAWVPVAGRHAFDQAVHESRTKPLRDFTIEDLRIMIAQQVALGRLVALSLDRLNRTRSWKTTSQEIYWPAGFMWTLCSGMSLQI